MSRPTPRDAPRAPGAWLRRLAWRLWHPRRTIWPTRDGWWSLFVVVALGVAAINTGNNLLYLLVSLLLALILISGVLSEQSMRGLAVRGLAPEAIYAGRPALCGATLGNRKRWLASYSVALECLVPDAPPRVLSVPSLEAGAERLLTWEETLPRRGRHRLAGVRLTTRFPFGLFLKAARPLPGPEVVVFPAMRPLSAGVLRELASAGDTSIRRRGRGAALHNLRPYRAGDEPRLIHWRSSAKTQSLMVRELEAETTEDICVVLVGRGAGETLEAGLSEAASIAAHLIRVGAAVALRGPGVLVPPGRGAGHLRRILTALALYEPGAPGAGGAAGASARPLREIRVRLG